MSTGDGAAESASSEVGRRLWVIVMAGVPTGVVVAGVGSRLVMLLLRVTSPASVRGLESDDGFTIGEFTLFGTYNLLMLGAAVGLIGAVSYRTVRRWLLGPIWFRRLTVAAASGAVVGSMLVHDDGIDFHALQPTWLAISLFVSLPAVFGWAIVWAVDRVEGTTAPVGMRRWLLPVVVVAAFPLAAMVAGLIAAGTVARVAVGRQVGTVVVPDGVGWLVRSAWAMVAMWGLVLLIRDVHALS